MSAPLLSLNLTPLAFRRQRFAEAQFRPFRFVLESGNLGLELPKVCFATCFEPRQSFARVRQQAFDFVHTRTDGRAKFFQVICDRVHAVDDGRHFLKRLKDSFL